MLCPCGSSFLTVFRTDMVKFSLGCPRHHCWRMIPWGRTCPVAYPGVGPAAPGGEAHISCPAAGCSVVWILRCELQNGPVWAHSAQAAQVPGDVYSLKTVPVLLQWLRNHAGPQGVGSLAGLKHSRSEVCLCLVGCEVAVPGWELVAGAVRQNMSLCLTAFLTESTERETALRDYDHIVMS